MLRTCPHCQKKNRIPAARLAQAGKCGACQEEIPAVEVPFPVGRDDFLAISKDAKVPVLVDFWAPWCGPCKAAAPILQKLATEFRGRALIVKVNTDEESALASEYGVRGIPHFVLLKDGAPAAQYTGLHDEAQMRSWLQAVVA